ncbi:MAG: hypothetical protein H6996_09595 [Moraxellaceae bacterium]|nr:hypothetical protein [Moraxellaceae bacterium]
MSLPRSGFPAVPERLRFATTGQIIGFGLLTALVFTVIYPEHSLQRHLERSAHTDTVSIAYLFAWLRADPNDHHLRILLAQRLFDKGDISQSRQILNPVFKVKDLKQELHSKADILLLNLLERQLWTYQPQSATFNNALKHYLQQLRKVSHYSWPQERLEKFAKNAFDFGDTQLAKELYYQLIFSAKTVNVEWFANIARLYLAQQQYRAAARSYLQAMPYTTTFAQRKQFFLSGVKALQSGNLLPDAVDAGQTYAGMLLADTEVLEYLTRLALAANRPDIAQYYVSLLLKQRISPTGANP